MKRAAVRAWVELPIATRDGTFVARYSVTGLAGLAFPAGQAAPPLLPRRSLPLTIRRWHRATAIALKRALAGRTPRVLPPLDLHAGTAFQQRVWQSLQEIPRGQTRTYGDIARTLRSVRAARAVGNACGANPIPVLIPCHRVVASHRKLGGYSGGLEWKRRLLWREEVRDWWSVPPAGEPAT